LDWIRNCCGFSLQFTKFYTGFDGLW